MRNSVLIKEIAKRTKLSIEQVITIAKRVSKEENTEYRNVLKELYEYYLNNSELCNVCYEVLKVGVSMMKCPKCDCECCTKCLITYMKHNHTFPVCTNFIKCGTVFDDFVLSSMISREDLRKYIFPEIKEILWIKKQPDIQVIISRIQTIGFMKERVVNPEKEIVHKEVVLPQSKFYGFIQQFKRLIAQSWGGTRTRSKCSITDLSSKLQEFFMEWSPAYTHQIILDFIAQHKEQIHFQTHEDVQNFIEYILSISSEAEAIYKSISREYREIPNYVFVDIKGNITPYIQEDDPSERKDPFVFRCIQENCQGYLNTNWRCLICDTQVCKDCHTIMENIGESSYISSSNANTNCSSSSNANFHICDENEVASIRKKMKMTKPCPECGARIYRPWGCNHMFCTQCNTGFDWESGLKISDRVNTNPYFKKWRETTGNISTLNIDNCGDVIPLPDFGDIIQKFKLIRISKRNADFIMSFRDLIDPELGNQYAVGGFHEQYPEVSHQARRALERHVERYLAGLIPEKKLKDILFRNYRIDQKHHHNRQVINTLETVGRELLYNFIYNSTIISTPSSSSSQSIERDDNVHQLVKSIHNLRKMINTSFREVGKVLGYSYGCYINTKLVLFTHASFSDSDMCMCKEHNSNPQDELLSEEVDCDVCKHILAGWFDAGIYATPNLIVDRCDNYDDMYELYGYYPKT